MDLTLFFFSPSPGCVMSSSFTFVNRWPGILANVGNPQLDSTGFGLPNDTFRSILALTSWSDRFRGCTGCDATGFDSLSCLTGDYGSGFIKYNGLGATLRPLLPILPLASGGQVYDVSLVDEYSVLTLIKVSGGTGMCASTGCSADHNQQCMAELQVGDGETSKSACEAFGSPKHPWCIQFINHVSAFTLFKDVQGGLSDVV